MYCPNRIYDGTATEMRQNLLQCQKHLHHYKKLYSAECKKCLRLQRQTCKLWKEIDILKTEILQFKSNVAQQEDTTVKYKKRKMKNWQNITSERTKRRRYAQYKNIIFETLSNIGVFH